MQDIYDGDHIHAWEDEDTVFLSFPMVTLNIPKEHWGQIVADLRSLVLIVREAEIQELKEMFDEKKN